MLRAKRVASLLTSAACVFPWILVDVEAAMVPSTHRVFYSPYHGIDWSSAHRCLSQHHDHLYEIEPVLRAYDDVGYQAVSALHYSGKRSVTSAWRERHWPISDYMPEFDSDEAFLETCKSLKFFIPNAEEIGAHHITSPFLTTYIALWEPEYYEQREPWHYDTSQQCIDLINAHGGSAILCHPWNSPPSFYLSLDGFAGIEVYSAYAAFNYLHGEWTWDRNERFLEVWDMLLEGKSTRLWGIAVNDWTGPAWDIGRRIYPEVTDSGKTVVLIDEWNLESYRRSFDQGAFFAVKDIGAVKLQYPRIEQITVGPAAISITTNGNVTWIANGDVVSTDPSLFLASLLPGAKYARAEVSNEFGTLFVQPFSLTSDAPADADRDGDVDLADFARFQACFSGGLPTSADACLCIFNDDVDGDIDEADFLRFEELMTGPR